MSPESENTRTRTRVDVAVKVLFNIGEKTTYFTESRDVSMSGIFLVTDAPPPIGTKGKVKIIMEFGSERLIVDAECEVARTNMEMSNKEKICGAGIKFTKIDPKSSINLYNIIKYQVGNENILNAM